MRRIPFIIGAAGSLALVTAPVAGASTSQTSSGKPVAPQEAATSQVAQNQGSKQNNQDNKQDYSKRKSWGGG